MAPLCLLVGLSGPLGGCTSESTESPTTHLPTGGSGGTGGGGATAGAGGSGGSGATAPGLQPATMECHTDQPSDLPAPPVVEVTGFGVPARVDAVSTPCPDDAPEIAGDGQRLYVWFQNYHDEQGVDFFNATEVRVFLRSGSTWDGPYVYPVDLGTAQSLDGEVSHTSAGDRVYFHSLRPENIIWPEFDGDVYVANVVDGVPEPATLVGAPVSTAHHDGEMAVSRDGDELFVASDRHDPGGALQIYRFETNG
ncbi:MAG: hypothetical protein JRI68_17345, partial [Deltaproteobacteria bacterium]|nr:hypothetical protein [Deltaproteobacteria bacterium]